MGTQPQPKVRFPKLSGSSARVLLLIAAVGIALLTGGVLVSRHVILAGGAYSNYPPAKATEMAREQQAMATARANSNKPSKATEIPSSPQPTATFQAGIVNAHQAPFPPSVFFVNNSYAGPVNGVWEVVYAGRVTNQDGSAGQGGLRIYNMVTDTNLGQFLAPAGTSALTITAVNGVVMQLRSDSGQLLTFNLQTHQYGQG
ncbi:MAG: hypothetical protein OJF49_003919 [Ktedonobacterales bacterium]|nr:MAG: hypothetical protein OJF49_003919 [Ktedonobacterales bacterium]